MDTRTMSGEEQIVDLPRVICSQRTAETINTITDELEEPAPAIIAGMLVDYLIDCLKDESEEEINLRVAQAWDNENHGEDWWQFDNVPVDAHTRDSLNYLGEKVDLDPEELAGALLDIFVLTSPEQEVKQVVQTIIYA